MMLTRRLHQYIKHSPHAFSCNFEWKNYYIFLGGKHIAAFRLELTCQAAQASLNWFLACECGFRIFLKGIQGAVAVLFERRF
jgi:hypothetical protein